MYYIRFVKLPFTVRGFCVEDENGFYNIYINDRLSHETQKLTIEHEKNHIKNNDFQKLEKASVFDSRFN